MARLQFDEMGVAGARGEGRAVRLMVLVPIVVTVLTDAGYLALVGGQHSRAPDVFTVPFIAGFMALMAVLLGLSLFSNRLLARLRPPLRAGAAAGLLVLGALAIFSIGLPLLLAGFLATGAAFRTLVGRGAFGAVSEVAAAVVVLALLVGGFEVTARLIVCPAGSSMRGTWPGIVTGGFSWECAGGQVQFK